MYKTNYHSHSTFCDGKSSMEDIAASAYKHGFTHWGISSHATCVLSGRFLQEERVPEYLATIRSIKEKYDGKMKIFAGLEIDFISDVMENCRERAKNYGLDYFIGSVHQVKEHNNSTDTWFIDGHDPNIYDEGLECLFDNDIHRAVRAYYSQQIEMIEKNRPDIIGHFDKIVMHNRNRFFTQDDKWYEELVVALIDTIQKYDTVAEINTRGLYKKRHDDFYPAEKWIKVLVNKNIPITISTDCHKDDEVDLYYDNALNLLKSLSCKEIYYFDNAWKSMSL